ncbi:MAG: TraR/DksA family transcriptional regulator [FCB group bacterium]|nr:TraR/DksA family transcriptional regulator [FCB group bacterium]
MNDKDLEYFRTLIIHNYLRVIDKTRVSAGLGSNSAESLNNLLRFTGKGGRNSRPEEKIYFFNREEEYMKHLIAALERIERKEYGLCVRCGNEIPKERLEEVPHTRYCVPCKNSA